MAITPKHKTEILEDKINSQKNELKQLEEALLDVIIDSMNLLTSIDSLYKLQDVVNDLISKWSDT